MLVKKSGSLLRKNNERSDEMSKNITEMSFDEIFPETSSPKKTSYSSLSDESYSDADPFTSDMYDNKDAYDYDDYGTDISSLEDELRKNTFPQDVPAPPPRSTDFASPVTSAPQYGGTNFPPPPSVPQYGGTNFPLPSSAPASDNYAGENNGFYSSADNSVPSEDTFRQTTVNMYHNYSSNSTGVSNTQKDGFGLILGIISLFTAGMFPLGLILAIAGLVMTNKEEKEAVKNGRPLPPKNKAGKAICIFSIIVNLLSSLTYLIPLFITLF